MTFDTAFGIAVGMKYEVHGWSKTPTYFSYRCMLARCLNPNNPKYSQYGGRGIVVCQRWRESFLAFLSDMGPKPKGCTIERVNNDGNYEPGNCRWATSAEQALNRRSNVRVTVNGVTKTVSEFAAEFGIDRDLVYNRVNQYGWTLEEALKTPTKGR